MHSPLSSLLYLLTKAIPKDNSDPLCCTHFPIVRLFLHVLLHDILYLCLFSKVPLRRRTIPDFLLLYRIKWLHFSALTIIFLSFCYRTSLGVCTDSRPFSKSLCSAILWAFKRSTKGKQEEVLAYCRDGDVLGRLLQWIGCRSKSVGARRQARSLLELYMTGMTRRQLQRHHSSQLHMVSVCWVG